MTKLILKIEQEDALIKFSTEENKIHMEIVNEKAEYSEIWIDYDNVVKLHERLGNFINEINKIL